MKPRGQHETATESRSSRPTRSMDAFVALDSDAVDSDTVDSDALDRCRGSSRIPARRSGARSGRERPRMPSQKKEALGTTQRLKEPREGGTSAPLPVCEYGARRGAARIGGASALDKEWVSRAFHASEGFGSPNLARVRAVPRIPTGGGIPGATGRDTEPRTGCWRAVAKGARRPREGPPRGHPHGGLT
jgi:hypothetical protein